MKFGDVAGCDGAKTELVEVVDFLKNASRPTMLEIVGVSEIAQILPPFWISSTALSFFKCVVYPSSKGKPSCLTLHVSHCEKRF